MRKAVLRRGRTIWQGRTKPAAKYPVLRGHHTTEVAIVGGGLTGAMIAQAFAEHGTRVVVLEAARVGQGSTAASTALLLQEPDYDLGALSKRFGPRAARRIWQRSFEAARDFVHTIRRLKIACDLRERDSLYYTLNGERAHLLRRELELRRKAKLPGEWLDQDALLGASGIHGAGAIKTHGNAQLNPLRACVGLLEAARKDGATIYEGSAVNRIRQVGDGVRLYSSNGTVDAKQVVIATGYATRTFRPLAGRFKMRHTYVMATDRLTPRQRRQLGLAEIMLWDTARPYHYLRWTPDHRLLLGGADRPVTPGARAAAQFAAAIRDLREYFSELFPVLGDVGIDRAWEGLFAMTPDGLPYIGAHRRYPRHAFALGYGGNGMTFATLAARMLVEQWRGVASPDHELFAFGRQRRRV
jgi:glycine/D-amino acid oxidase-like deaminating enzyme